MASVFAVLNRIETASHILVWCTPLPPNSPPSATPTIARVELPRLGLSFTEGVQGKVRRLSSIDHAARSNLFLPNFSYGSTQVRDVTAVCCYA